MPRRVSDCMSWVFLFGSIKCLHSDFHRIRPARIQFPRRTGASGGPRDLTLSGFSEDERRALLEWPDRHALFAHLRSLAGPLRVPDLAAHIHARGFSAIPVPAGAFQATPMRHGEDCVGGFFLGGRGPTSRRWSRPARLGAVVFDAQSGAPLTFNREARRIGASR